MTTTTTVQIPGVGNVDMWLQATQPARTLMCFAGIAQDSLGSATYNAIPLAMWGYGWNVLSFDLPGHGANLNAGETYTGLSNGLQNWVARSLAGENIAKTFSTQAQLVVDWLIANGKAQAGKIAVSGFSRGGFFSIHALEAVPDIVAAVGLSPVLDPAVLTEFSGVLNNWLVKQMALGVSFKSTKPVYIEISNTDSRVSAAAAAHNVGDMLNRMLTVSQIEFHVGASVGHTPPAGAETRAASWLNAKVS